VGPGPLSQSETPGLSVGLIAALPAESRCLTNQVIGLNTPVRINHQLVCLVCGIGAERAYQAAQSLLALDIKALISWGTAGALIDELRSGDLFIPDKIYSASGDTYTPDSEWRQRIIQCLTGKITIHTGSLVETTDILMSAGQKSVFRTKTGANATDMETAAIMKSALDASVPSIAIRSIVDESDMNLPAGVLKHINAYGKPDLLHLLAEILHAPQQTVGLCQLLCAMKAAMRTLTIVAHETNETLMYPY